MHLVSDQKCQRLISLAFFMPKFVIPIFLLYYCDVLKNKIMFDKNERIPSKGYRTPFGFGSTYRATAIAYLEREGLFTIEHANGNFYTLTQLKNARVG